ncbi:MAG: EAL domain-containing protein [Gammaproteobacteria bacterium]|nr:EAL domain-containing protein [Gammaproteobacteria bacterium]
MINTNRFSGIPGWLTYGILYFSATLGGLLLVPPPDSFLPIGLAAGFAVSGTLAYGFRVLPGIWAGGACALFLTGVSPVTSLMMAIPGAAGAIFAYLLLKPFASHQKLLLSKAHSLAYFLLLGVLLSTLAGALVNLLILIVSEAPPLEMLLEQTIVFWLRDATGVILITPLLIAMSSTRPASVPRAKEIIIINLMLLVTCLLIYNGMLPEAYNNYPVYLVPLPLIVWAALRFDLRINCLTLLLITLMVLWGYAGNLGPIVRDDGTEAMLALQIYILTLGATALMINVMVSEHGELFRRLNLAGKVIASSPYGIIVTDIEGIALSANPAFYRTTGFQKSRTIGHSIRHLISVHHNEDFFTSILHKIQTSGHWEGEIWNRNKTGELIPQWLVMTPIRDAELGTTHYLGIFSDLSRQEQVKERIRRLAYYDALTGLPNRQLFSDRIEQSLKHADRHNSRLALFFLDLDRFKNINDTLGHSVGDRVLQMIGKRLSECARQTDTLARLGGDEFTLVIQDLNEEFDVVLVAKKVVKQFKKPFKVYDNELFLTPSIGIALYPDDGKTSEELLKHADTAMYRAKELGGNGFQFFSADMSDPIRWNLTIENALRRSIEMNSIQVVYQPQFDLHTGSIVGLEALARWHHKGPQETPPDVFIKVAEDTGLIHRLGELVLETACKQSVKWCEEGMSELKVAVNISPVQLRQNDFPNHLNRIVEQTGAAPSRIELEITETALMENAGFMENLLNLLSVQGFRIAIDDFGTGYSSLNYLKRLALHSIKIDHSFVKEIPDDANNSAICSAIISMAHSLKLRVIAEGVENRSQMDFLRQKRCDEIQGHILSKPVGAGEVSEMIRLGYWHTQS